MRNSSDERLPTVLVQPWIIRSSAIRLDIVETRDCREGDSSIEQRPSISWLGSTCIGLVDIRLEKGS